jgi:serine/threonine-protein kinase
MPGVSGEEDFAGLIGSVVAGKYRIERSIGRGGMGAVYQATNTAIGKRVALKFLNREAAEDSAATQRFQREAEAASSVESAHIVQIFDSGRTEDSRPFLVMELLTGEDLRSRLRREQRLSATTAVCIAVQVLKALTRAHRSGIVHRDLKPDNIFLCKNDDDELFVKVVDFGISKLARASKLDTLTQSGTVLGTVFYMSPEQAQSLPDVDGRTDLFSLGAILFEMLTGAPPHTGPTYEAVIVRICTKDAPDVRTRAPRVPEVLAKIIARALNRDRSHRFASAEEFLSELEPVLRELEANTNDRGRITGDSAVKVKRRASYGTFVLSALAMLSGFIVAAYFITTNRAAQRESVERSTTPALVATPAAPPKVSVSALPSPAALPSASAEATPNTKGAQTPQPALAKKSAPKQKAATSKSLVPNATSGVARSLELSTREP